MKNKARERILSLTPISVICCYLSMMQCEGFTAITTTIRSSVPFVKKQSIVNNGINNNSIKSEKFKSQTQTYLQAPPGSGYLTVEDEESEYPDTYEPMMEYPGTMRPGRTPENQPYSSLPIQESDPDPVPWPHFQEIEWHHNWGSPHEHPIPMEEFIDMHGRWATAEMEAEMRAGARRGVRERRELEEAQKAASFILDDDEEDEEGEDSGPQLDLGEGVDALIGAGAAAAATITKSATKEDDSNVQLAATDDDDDDDDDDNFLLDLGLDETEDEDDEEDEGEIGDDGKEPAFATGDDSTEGILEAMQSMIDAEDDTKVATDGDDNEIDIDFDDLGLNFDDEDDDEDDDDDDEVVSEGGNDDDDEFVVMDDDDISMENEDLTLDEMVGNEDMGADDEFDDGGFDYD